MSDNKLKVIDDSALDFASDDVEFKKEIMTLFINSAEEYLEGLETSLEEEDNDRWYSISHTFKGSAGIVGAKQFSLLLAKAQMAKDFSYFEKKEILVEIKKQYLEVDQCAKQIIQSFN